MAANLLLIISLLAVCLIGGCEPTSDSQDSSKIIIIAAWEDAVLLKCRYKNKCGPARCPKCGLFKGSPGCCLSPKIETVVKNATPSPEPEKTQRVAAKGENRNAPKPAL